MRTLRRRVVIASAMPDEVQNLRAALEKAGFSETVCVSDGISALRRVQDAPTDLVVADAVLPAMDGRMLAERIAQESLPVMPAVILLAFEGMCPKNAADCVLVKPVHAQTLMNALPALTPEKRRIPDRKRAMALELLKKIGIPEHCGREYLVRAIELAWLDSRLLKALTSRVYPVVAQEAGVDDRHVIRAVKHVIDEAWRSGEMDEQYRIFGDTIDARRGSPTAGEMIARIAEILRWEGRA